VITGNGSLTVDTYNNIASSANNYTLGRVSLSQDNSAWSGNLTIARGTLTIQGTSLTGQQTGSGILTIGTEGDSFGAGLSMFSSANNTTSFLVNNDVVVTSGGFRSIKGGNTDHGLILNGNVTLNENSVLNLDHEMSSTRSIALNGNITGLGGLSITRNGGSATSSVTLTGTNNYLGATTIASGARLFIGAGGTTGSVTSNIVNDGTLIFNRSNASSYDGAITGTGTFTKTGAGALTLDGTSNYGGNTTVSTGALIIDGAVTTSATIVASGARIGGDGAITGGLSLASGAQFVFSLTATLDVSGAVTLDNSFGVGSLVNADGTAINWSSVGLGTYALINTASTFNNITNFGFDNRSVNIGGSGKDVYFTNGSLQLVVIPETSTWAIVGIGLFGMVVFHRIRRRSRGV
jgi:autotransporter-associated beta strand protein